MVECYISFGASRRAMLVLVGTFLCGMKLSTDFYLLYSNSNKAGFAGDYTGLLLQTMQQEVQQAEAVIVQETRRTTSLLRRALTDVQEFYDTPNRPAPRPNTANSNYAYAFVIGGCNPENPSYRGFIYNILVTARLLKQEGSTADVVAFFQLSYGYQGGTVLPDEDVRMLEGLNVHIYYIPPSAHESFYEIVMNKFRILQLTQYRRVLLMDGDVMPVSNLDYLFQLSDDNKYGPGNSTLKENLIVAGPWEPANAGFFMLAPAEGEYERISEIIAAREEKVRHADGIKFDEVEGWGHVITAPDEWVSRKARGTNWTFHFAFSDQGLLYHWTKYVKKSVSIVFHGRVENWSVDENGKLRLERELENLFLAHSKPLVRQAGACRKFMCDYQHFTGLAKPWLRKPPKDLSEKTKVRDAKYLWWYFLKMVDQELGIGLDFENWSYVGRPSLGLYATWRDMNNSVMKNETSSS